MRAEPRPQTALGLRRCSLAPSLQAVSFPYAWPGRAPRRPWPESALLLGAIPQGVGLARHRGPSLCPLSQHHLVIETNFFPSDLFFSPVDGETTVHRLPLSSSERSQLEPRKEQGPQASLEFVSLEGWDREGIFHRTTQPPVLGGRFMLVSLGSKYGPYLPGLRLLGGTWAGCGQCPRCVYVCRGGCLPIAPEFIEGGGWQADGRGASGCSRCFQLTFQNGLLLAAHRQGGEGSPAAPEGAAGPCLAAWCSLSLLSLYSPPMVFLCESRMVGGRACVEEGLQRKVDR